MAIGQRAHRWTTFPLMQWEDYKLTWGYHPTPEEIVKGKQEAQSWKTASRRGVMKELHS